MKKLSKRAMRCIGLLTVIAVLYVNTNNNPVTLLERIIPPYHKDGTTIMVANIVMFFCIPFILFHLYKETQWHFLNAVPKRLICAALYLAICGKVTDMEVQVFKSFQTDLDAIYLDRERYMGVTYRYETVEEGDKVYVAYYAEASMTLKNCSNKETLDFQVQLELDDQDRKRKMLQEVKETLGKEDRFTLLPGETKQIIITSKKELKEVKELEEIEEVQEDIGLQTFSKYPLKKIILYNDEMSSTFIRGY